MSKIAVLDSGFGGLTVLRELLKLMPDEEYIFYGDSANAPYGDKQHDELLKLTSDICMELSSAYDIRSFVVACNTTSSEVWDELTAQFPDYDFIGIEPALKQAVSENKGKRILVLATTATINGKRLRRRYEELKAAAEIELLAAPGIVPFVESCNTESDEFKAYLESLLAPYKGRTDCVVLGCTHFPFVKNEIREVLGGNPCFYDAAVNAAREAAGIDTGSGIPVRRAGSAKENVKVFGTGQKTEQKPEQNTELNPEQKPEREPEQKPEQNGYVRGNVIYLNSDPSKTELEAGLLDIYSAK